MAKLTQLEKYSNKCYRLFKNGWTLHCWRGSTPCNWWIESPKGRMLPFEGGPISKRLHKDAVLLSEIGKVHYPGIMKFSDHGKPEHEIWKHKDFTK